VIIDPDLFAYETLSTSLGEMRWPGHREEVGVTPGVREAGEYRSAENALLREWFKPGGVFVDVGAHVGWFSLLAAQSGMRVAAIEPSPTNFRLLAWNLRAHPATLFNCAAFDSIQRLDLTLSVHNSGDHRVWDHEDDAPVRGLSTMGLPLDELVDRADVVKIDAQGSDHRALMGMGRIIKEHRPRIVLEFSPYHIRQLGDDPERVLDDVRSLGYEVAVVGDHDERYAIKHDWDCNLVLT
jgi:FkbM family methyltransferase